MRHRSAGAAAAGPLAILALGLMLGCASHRDLPDDFALEESGAEESSPLGGEALAQRKQEMERAHNDMLHFHATLESLQYRRDRNGMVLFSGFLDRYMGEHLTPLLQSEWQSRHPELMALDANLRFVQATVLIQLRSPRRVQRVIDEIERRYGTRTDMLVEFPIGSQGTVNEGIEKLRNSKWRG